MTPVQLFQILLIWAVSQTPHHHGRLFFFAFQISISIGSIVIWLPTYTLGKKMILSLRFSRYDTVCRGRYHFRWSSFSSLWNQTWFAFQSQNRFDISLSLSLSLLKIHPHSFLMCVALNTNVYESKRTSTVGVTITPLKSLF